MSDQNKNSFDTTAASSDSADKTDGNTAAENSASRARGLALLDQMLGPDRARATREAWLALAPDFERYVVEFLSGEVWSRPLLERKIKSLCTIAALAALGRSQGLELNARMALNNGASREEIIEALLRIAPYAGFPACWEGLVIADRVFKEQLSSDGSPDQKQS